MKTQTKIRLNSDGRTVVTVALQSTEFETVCHVAASLLATVAMIAPRCDEARFESGGKRYRIGREAATRDFTGIARWADLAEETSY